MSNYEERMAALEQTSVSPNGLAEAPVFSAWGKQALPFGA